MMKFLRELWFWAPLVVVMFAVMFAIYLLLDYGRHARGRRGELPNSAQVVYAEPCVCSISLAESAVHG